MCGNHVQGADGRLDRIVRCAGAHDADAWLHEEGALGSNMRIILFAAIWFAVGLLSVFVLAGVLEAMALRH